MPVLREDTHFLGPPDEEGSDTADGKDNLEATRQAQQRFAGSCETTQPEVPQAGRMVSPSIALPPLPAKGSIPEAETLSKSRRCPVHLYECESHPVHC